MGDATTASDAVARSHARHPEEVLVEEREFLLRSLRDLEAERQAGDIDEVDFVSLRDDYTSRAAAVIRELDLLASSEGRAETLSGSAEIADGQMADGEMSADAADEGPAEEGADDRLELPPVSLRRRIAQRPLYKWGVSATVGALAVAVSLVWVAHSSSTRLPGETVTGSLNGIAAELQQADALSAQGHPVQALELYAKVLHQDPEQPEALTAEGWLYAEAGVVKQGFELLTDAEIADPSYGLAHLYRGLVLLTDEHQPTTAASELRWYLSHDPNPSAVATAKAALALAQKQATSTSTTSTSTT